MALKRHIPNFITSLNAVFGLLGIVCAVNCDFRMALIMMLLASVADFLDGFTARLLGVSSPMGKELDSLCDLITFGVLPSLMLLKYMQGLIDIGSMGLGAVIIFTPLLIAVFSALRLAKFNIDPRQSESFIGLATPACALLCASLCVYAAHGSRLAHFFSLNIWAIPVFCVILCALLVAEIPMFSMKFKKGKLFDDKFRLAFFGLCICASAFALIAERSFSLAILLIFIIYVLVNLVRFPFIRKDALKHTQQ